MLGGHIDTYPHCYGAPEQGYGYCWEAAMLSFSISHSHKNLLMKFALGGVKKNWYGDSSLGSHFTYKPPKMEFRKKCLKKPPNKQENGMHQRTLNGLIIKPWQICCTSLKELRDLWLEPGAFQEFSECWVYWKTTLAAGQKEHTETMLQECVTHEVSFLKFSPEDIFSLLSRREEGKERNMMRERNISWFWLPYTCRQGIDHSQTGDWTTTFQ